MPLRNALRLRIATAFALMAAGPIVAEPPLPRLTSAAEQAAWPMIGRVNLKGLGTRRMCTGTLIAPALVLTAAHCAHLPPGRAPSDLIFVAGWRQGSWQAGREIARIAPHPDWKPTHKGNTLVETDLALLHLARPIPEIPPLPLARAPDNAELQILAYRADRPHALSHHAPCPITGRQGPILRLPCPVAPGSSGGPVIWMSPEGPRLAALISATSRSQAFAVAITPWPGLQLP